MLKNIIFLKKCPCCNKKNLFFKKKKKKNHKIFGVKRSHILSSFNCSECSELIIYVNNDARGDSLLWTRFEEEAFELYEERDEVLRNISNLSNKNNLKKIEEEIKEKKHTMLAGLFVRLRKMSA